MKQILKLKLVFKDRVGIIADISSLLAQNGININTMEVKRENRRTNIFFEVASGEKSPEKTSLIRILNQIPDLQNITFMEILPHEARENSFKVVLDNMSDGVIAIDQKGNITILNSMARKTLDAKGKNLIGKPLTNMLLPDYHLLKCLAGEEISNQKKSFNTPNGRFQYFTTQKPIRDFSGNIVGAVEIAKDMQEIKKLARSISDPTQITFGDVIGEHPALKQAISFAQKIAGTDSIISLRGESGTGKELFAKAIHQASNRRGNFVPINCAALPESLLESELFGYAGGAFTGAQKHGKPGLFEQAADGTIFLDEIGDLPLGPQAKLLRAIQDKLVRRIGGSKEIPITARVITATNRSLEQMVEQKEFRQDLYYRINVLPIHIPPLRERREDIPLLAEHFLFQLTSRLNRPARELTKQAMFKLKNHDWPGNVRELKNVIERAAILGEAGPVAAENILFSFELATPNRRLGNSLPQTTKQEANLKQMLAEYEKAILTQILKRKTSIRTAATNLGISHTTLLNKIKKHGL